jgi:hypothetical protein
MMATYKQILESLNLSEEKPKNAGPGDVWRTDTGGFRGINKSGNSKTFQDKEKTQKYVATKDSPKDDTEKDEEEPKKEKPKQKSKSTATGYKGDKNKSLDDVDTSSSSTFTEEIDPSDEDYTPPKGFKNPDPPPPFKMPEMKSAKFPKKYMNAIERMMNSTKSGEKPITQDFIKGVGAGQAGSQAGEILTVMATGLDKEEWDAVKTSLLEHEAALIEKNPKLKNPKKRLIDKSWIEAADNNRLAIERQVEGMYGKGSKILNTGWDVEADVEAMGWKGRYKESKGYSTDMYAKVQRPDGSIVMHEPSLKKDDKINFINKTTGSFENWLGEGNVPENLDPQKLGNREQDRLKALDPEKVNTMTQQDPLKSYMESKGFKIEQILDPSSGKGKTRHKKKAAFMAMNMIAGAPEYGYQETGPNKGKVLLANPPTTEQLAVKEHIDDVRKYCDDATRAIGEPSTPNKPNKLRDGMLKAVSEEFPLKGVADQEETMAIGASSLDPQTMENIFGTSNFDDIKQDLVVDDSVNPPHLAYSGGPDGKLLRLATIKIRQDGIGYGAPNIKFEMNMDKEFADRLRQANEDVYGEKKEQYESLEGTISRIRR